MKTFIRNITVFTLICFFLMFIISGITVSDEYMIYKTKDTHYNKLAFNLNLIHTQPDRIRGAVILLGSSAINRNICDSTLNSHGIKAVNMGVNHTGNELELYLLRRIVHLRPSSVFVYAGPEEKSLHPMTSLVYTPVELIRSGQSLNIHFIKYLKERVTFVLDYLLWKYIMPETPAVRFKKHGVSYQNGVISSDGFNKMRSVETALNDIRKRAETGSGKRNKDLQTIRYTVSKSISALFDRYISNKRSQARFLNKMNELAGKNHIEFGGFYTPMIHDVFFDRKYPGTMFVPGSKIRALHLPDYGFLNSYNYWFDHYHLSKAGAFRLTEECVKMQLFKQQR